MAAAFLREQEIQQAGPVQADPEQPVTTEAQSPIPPELARDIHWAASVRKNEAWMIGEDLARSTVELPRNIAANLIGELPDIAQLLADIGGPVRQVVLGGDPLEDVEIDVPFTPDEIVIAMGGDPESTQFKIAQFIPTPFGSADIGVKLVTQAIAIGAIAVRRQGGPLLKRLNDFLGGGGNDLPIFHEGLWTKTGWYRGKEGLPRFYLSDANSKVNQKLITEHPRILAAQEFAKKSGESMVTRINLRFGEVLEHNELYDLYPELKGVKITTWVVTDPDGAIQFRNLSRQPNFKGGVISTPQGNVIMGVEMGTLEGAAEYHETILHEAQHIIQTIEGFAQGTSSKLTLGMIRDLRRTTVMKRATKLIDDGAVSTDGLGDALKAEGFSDLQIEMALTDNNIQQYQQATVNIAEDGIVDDFAREFMFDHNTNIDLRSQRAQGDMVHVLDFLFKGETPEEGAKMLTQLGEHLTGKELSNIGFEAYLHSAGEAEARLTGLMRDLSQDQIKQLRNVDPSFQAGLTQGQELSIGPTRKPGTTVVIEQPVPQPPVSGPVFESVEEVIKREAIRADFLAQK